MNFIIQRFEKRSYFCARQLYREHMRRGFKYYLVLQFYLTLCNVGQNSCNSKNLLCMTCALVICIRYGNNWFNISRFKLWQQATVNCLLMKRYLQWIVALWLKQTLCGWLAC